MLGPRRFMGTGRGLDILWQHIMQIDYARYPGMVGNDWSGAVQNPAYRLSVKNPPHGGFFISPIITQVTIYLYDICLSTCHCKPRQWRGNPVNKSTAGITRRHNKPGSPRSLHSLAMTKNYDITKETRVTSPPKKRGVAPFFYFFSEKSASRAPSSFGFDSPFSDCAAASCDAL